MAAGFGDVAGAAMNSRSNSGTKSEVRAASSVTRWLTRRYALHRIRDTGSSDAFVALFTCQTARVCSFPRRVFCARVLLLASLTRMRGGGAPRDVRMLARHPLGLHVTRQARHLSRRLASHNAGRPPPGAPPWRF